MKRIIFILFKVFIVFFVIFFIGLYFLFFRGYNDTGNIWEYVPEKTNILIGTKSLSGAIITLKESSIIDSSLKQKIPNLKPFKGLLNGEAVIGIIKNRWFLLIDLGYKTTVFKTFLSFFHSNIIIKGDFSVEKIKFNRAYIYKISKKNSNQKRFFYLHKNYIFITPDQDIMLDILDVNNKRKGSLLRNITFPIDFYVNKINKADIYVMPLAFSPFQSKNSRLKKEAMLLCIDLKKLNMFYYIKTSNLPYNYVINKIDVMLKQGIIKIEKHKDYKLLSFSALSRLPFNIFSLYIQDTGKTIYGANSKYLFEKLTKKAINDPVYIIIEPSTLIFVLNLLSKHLDIDITPIIPLLKDIDNIVITLNKTNKPDFLNLCINIKQKKRIYK